MFFHLCFVNILQGFTWNASWYGLPAQWGERYSEFLIFNWCLKLCSVVWWLGCQASQRYADVGCWDAVATNGQTQARGPKLALGWGDKVFDLISHHSPCSTFVRRSKSNQGGSDLPQ